MKINLIHPANDKVHKQKANEYSVIPPPTGLEVIASYVQDKNPNVEIKVYDRPENYDSLEGDLIGVTDLFTSHETAMDIARTAKEQNPQAKIVIGGPNASNLGERILQNHPYVDFVVYGDGEESVLGLSRNQKLSTIPNLGYRGEDGKINFSFFQNVNINELPLFDFSHVVDSNLGEYDSRKEGYFEEMFKTPVSLSLTRGCIKSTKLGKCSYCTIPIPGLRLTKPKKAWEQIRLLNEKYGVQYFFESGDNFVIGNYPEKLLDAKPSDLEISLRMFSSPNSIDKHNAEILGKLGTDIIFMGVEHADPKILSRANKHSDVKKVKESVKNCKDQGIRVMIPFMFGLPGESEETAKKNVEFAYEIAEIGNISQILYSFAIPLIGSKLFEDLSKNEDVKAQYPEIEWEDNLDYRRLIRLSIDKFCTVSFDRLLEIMEDLPDFDDKRRILHYGSPEGVK